MIIKAIDAAMIQQMNDVSQIKQHENSKPVVEQQNINVQVNKDVNTKSEQVTQKDAADQKDREFNAKDKSDNEYYQDDNSKGKQKKSDGRVFLKNQKKYNFDIKI